MGTEKIGGRPVGLTPRLADWRERLAAVVASGNVAPWAWGGDRPHDCLAFAARVVAALTGRDLYEPFRGRYSDEAGAAALVPDVGAFMDAVAADQRWPIISERQALEGDLGLFGRPGSLVLVGAVYGRLIFPREPAGLGSVARASASKIWAVG
jgi:hypothetical protein